MSPEFGNNTPFAPRTHYTRVPDPARSLLLHAGAPTLHALFHLYLIGAGFAFLQTARSVQRGRGTAFAGNRCTTGPVHAMLARQVARLGLRRQPALAFSREILVPAVAGVFRPIILLPCCLPTGLSPDQIEMLIAHELAHVKRLDPWVNAVQRLIEAALFFHPAVHRVSRWVRAEREKCCDDHVVRAGHDPGSYARSLLECARLSRALRVPLPALVCPSVAKEEGSSLRDRILHLLNSGSRQPSRIPHAWIFACAIVAALAPAAGPYLTVPETDPFLRPDNGSSDRTARVSRGGPDRTPRADRRPFPSRRPGGRLERLESLGNAAFWDNQWEVEVLLDAAPPAEKAAWTATALDCAIRGGALSVVRLALAAGASPDATNAAGLTPVHRAVLMERVDIVESLLGAGASIDHQAEGTLHSGDTPLHLAVRLASVPLVKYLLAMGADPKIGNGSGRTPLDIAAENGESNLVRLLENTDNPDPAGESHGTAPLEITPGPNGVPRQTPHPHA